MTIDYALYLVTDSTPEILKGQNLVEIVEAAIDGGVTVVQYRNKSSPTLEVIRTCKEIHEVTKRQNVPLIINDHLDVAVAVDAEGVHIGQDDIDIRTARSIVGSDKIIGVTVSSVEEAIQAVENGADYLGIGTIFATPTKRNTDAIIGTGKLLSSLCLKNALTFAAGTKNILEAISSLKRNVATVVIGGINHKNVQRVLFQSKSSSKGLDGVAVVSAIIGAENPKEAASKLRRLVDTPPPFIIDGPNYINKVSDVEVMRDSVVTVLDKLGEMNPLCHNMTNLVVQNFAANVALAIGASPIMANYGEEAEDLAALGGSLVINMGTVTPDGLQNYLKAVQAYNVCGGPVLLDPVGAGATGLRRRAVRELLAGGYYDVIKGNEGEIKTVLGEGDAQQRGVDSGASTSTEQERAGLVKKLAARERNVVLMTGVTDYLSDGKRTIAIGTTIAACLAVHREDKLLAALAGILLFEIAAEKAAEHAEGPGTFVPAFIDQLYRLTQEVAAGRAEEWVKLANVQNVEV
ncbi:MAG: hypothetical protein M1833_002998 [Piccolia ochrophora]|nr:MAG: hypothetical protein M1833_002998 [Piccolia ochrophora]